MSALKKQPLRSGEEVYVGVRAVPEPPHTPVIAPRGLVFFNALDNGFL